MTQEAGLTIDESPRSHPISTMDNINFDGIVYQKGACMLRMLSAVLGENVLQRALQIYIQRHQYGNARKEQLWEVLTQVNV